MKNILPGIYRHYKGGLYEVTRVGKIEASHEDVVVYTSLQDKDGFKAGSTWVRPLTVFVETVEHNGVELPRFKKVNHSHLITPVNALKLTWFPFLVFMLNIIINSLWPREAEAMRIDMYLHFFGGVSIAYSTAYALSLLQKANLLIIKNSLVRALQTVTVVALAAILWELWEFWQDIQYGTLYQPSLADTMKDLLLGLCGGIVYSLITAIKKPVT